MTQTQKIESLTPAQEIRLEEFYQESLKIGLSTAPADRPTAEAAITKLYEKMGEKVPNFIWVDSPLAAEKFINAQLGKTGYNGTSFWGSQDMYWVAFYKFGEEIGVKYDAEDSALLETWNQIAKSCSWWYPFTQACVVCERPSEIHMTPAGTLHCETGAAVKFRDGFGIYSLNDVSVPAWLVEKKASEITGAEILGLENAQQRAEGIKKVGILPLLKDLDAEVIDVMSGDSYAFKNEHPNEYELFTFAFEGRRIGPYLKMVNPSTGQIHVEGVGEISSGGVDGNLKTCAQALAWRAQDTDYIAPVQKT